MKTFKEYNLNEKTNEFIQLNHFKQPTPIQERVIPMALKGKDIVAISDTGTGKTHAFLIPLMQMIDTSKSMVQAVITTPTRELAMQIYECSKLMSKANPDLKVRLITGGSDSQRMADSLKQQPHLVIGTPGRIKDLFLTQSVLRVDSAHIYVVDEADMTLEYGFLDDVDAICSRMKNLQMMCFSATIPQALRPFLKKYMNHPQTIQINEDSKFNPQIEHILVPCKHHSYEQVIKQILPGFMPYVCLIFANTREEASKIADSLKEDGTPVIEIHGGLEARKRKQALKQIASDKKTYVVATDIAARGLDIDGITHVISCGLPEDLSFYIHRSGRTGRAGKDGTCFLLYHEQDEKAIKDLKNRGLKFEHKSFTNGAWRDLKPLGYKRTPKSSELDIAISKQLKRKKEKVKPGYKKKRAAEVEKIKRKAKRDQIRKDIKAEKKEMFKRMQIEKKYGKKQ